MLLVSNQQLLSFSWGHDVCSNHAFLAQFQFYISSGASRLESSGCLLLHAGQAKSNRHGFDCC